MIIIRKTSTENGTFGIWYNDYGNILCYTVERPWADNQHGISCIPPAPGLPSQTYKFIQYDSPKHGQVWMAQNVPDRQNIEIHNANWATQLEGCVGVGDKFEMIEGIPGVANSLSTLDMLRGTLPDSFDITFQWGT